MRDYYAELQVAPDADAGVIAAAYRHLARLHHPDVAGTPNAARMRSLNEAYAVLGDPEKRRRYDASRRSAKPALTAVAAAPERNGKLRSGVFAGVLLVVFGFLFGIVLASAGFGLVTLAWQQHSPQPSAQATDQRAAVARPSATARRSSPSASEAAASVSAGPVDGALAVPPSPPRATPAPDGEMVDLSATVSTPGPTPAVTHTPDPPIEPTPTARPAAPPAPTATALSSPAPVSVASAPTRVYVRHVVGPSENVIQIARRYGVTEEEVIVANGLVDANLIYAGEVLLIPQWR